MKNIFLIFFIVVNLFSACSLPDGDIKLFILSNNDKIDGYNSYKKHYNFILSRLMSNNFLLVDNKNEDIIIVYFEQLENVVFKGTSKAIFQIINSTNNRFILLKVEVPFEVNDTKFSKKIVYTIKQTIKQNNCELFQSIFDKQIALEKQQSLKNSQQRAIENNKEEKRRTALEKLAKEKNYTKLKKVLKIKPEYKSLLDKKTQTMLIGHYCLGDISLALQNGMSDTQMIKELDKNNFTYLPNFSLEQKDYLREEGLSPKLIEFLELHTQEINIKREQQQRIATLERERMREQREAKEEIEAQRRNEKRRRERQEEKRADAQRWNAMSNAITQTTNDMIYTMQNRTNQQQYATNVYNNSINPTNTTSYNSTYHKKKTVINSNYNNQLASIRAKKMQLQTQQTSNSINCYTSGSYTTGRYRIRDSGETFQSKPTIVVAITNFKYGSLKHPLEEEDVIFKFSASDTRSCPYKNINDAINYIYTHNKHLDGFREWRVISN